MAGRPVATMVVMPFGHIKNHSYPFQLKPVLGKFSHPGKELRQDLQDQPD
jgi:hypothetical protein